MADHNFATTSEELQAEAFRKADAAAAGLADSIRDRRVAKSAFDEDLRIFVAPLEPNTSFMVKPGTMHSINFQNDLGRRDLARDLNGTEDTWAVFTQGVCASRDPDTIAWLEAHCGDEEAHETYHREINPLVQARNCEATYGLCRDATWDGTSAWADMKALQQPTSRRNAHIPMSTNVDHLFKHAGGAAVVAEAGSEVSRIDNVVRSARNADKDRS